MVIQRDFSDSHQSPSSLYQVLFSMYVQTALGCPERYNFVTESLDKERHWSPEVFDTPQEGCHPQLEPMLSLVNFAASTGGPL